MDTKLQQRLLRTSSVLLVLAMLLSGQVPSVTALRNYQEPPLGQTTQGYGDFPRLPIVAPGAVRAWSVSTGCSAFLPS